MTLIIIFGAVVIVFLVVIGFYAYKHAIEAFDDAWKLAHKTPPVLGNIFWTPDRPNAQSCAK